MLINPFLHRLERFYTFFIKIGSSLQSLLLLYMRLTWGKEFFLSGLSKFDTLEEVTQFFSSLHIPHPSFHAQLVGLVEMIGGFLILIGFASRMAAIPLIIVMLTALSTAHAPELSEFRFLLEPLLLVRQEPYPYLVTALLVFVFGPGKISVDALLKRWIRQQPRY